MRDALLRRSGVAEVQVDLQSNLVRIVPESSVAFDLRSIPYAIRDAGFRPGEMTIRARGRMKDVAGAPGFLIAGWSAEMRVASVFQPVDDKPVRARYRWKSDPPTLERLRD